MRKKTPLSKNVSYIETNQGVSWIYCLSLSEETHSRISVMLTRATLSVVYLSTASVCSLLRVSAKHQCAQLTLVRRR